MHTFVLTYFILLLPLPSVILPAVILSSAVQAQESDSQGNYYSNQTTVQAPNRFSKLSAGSLWRVVVNQLSCRQEPSLDSPVSRTYLADALLEVEVYRGGSDEVLINPRDRYGKPWMPVRGETLKDVCYVRANSRYIQPVTLK